jgi:hypothetical protein
VHSLINRSVNPARRKDEGFALPTGLVPTVQVRPNSLPNVSTLYLRSCRSSESVKAEGA